MSAMSNYRSTQIKLPGPIQFDVRGANVNDCVSDFSPGVCPSAPADLSLDCLIHHQTYRQTFKNNVCPSLFRIELLEMRADQNGRWTSNDD